MRSQPTCRLVAGHSDQALLLDVGFGGGVAAPSMEPPVIDAQHHPVAQALTTGHRALLGTWQMMKAVKGRPMNYDWFQCGPDNDAR